MPDIIIFNDCNGPLGFGRYAGPYRIATELRDNGFSVQTIEFFGDMSAEEVYSVIDAQVTTETLWVGFASTLFGKHMTFEEDVKVWTTPPMGGLKQLNNVWATLFPHTDDEMQGFIHRIKGINPECKIVVGGYKALVREFEGIDYWVVGQGEGPSVAISNHLKYNTPLTFLPLEGSRVVSDKMYEYTNFNSSKITWHSTDHILPGEDLPIETARGCIFKCAFCAFNLNGKKFGDFTKQADILREELIYNYENFGTTGYMVSDDTLNDSVHKVEYLHKIMTSLPFKPRLTAYLRLDIIASKPETIPLLHEMGLSSTNFGIETFNRTAGRAIGKGADPGLIKETLFQLQDAWGDDVFTTANFIVGLPYESRESLLETYEWLHRPDVPLHGMSVNRLYIKQYNRGINPEVSDEQMIKYGFVKAPDGWQYNAVSKIEVDPKKYNMEYGNDEYFIWRNEHMDFIEADKYVDMFYADPRNATKKFSLAMFLNYNRMMNLGYNREELMTMYQNDPNVAIEAIKRRKTLKDEYLGKILSNYRSK